jgi:hypothetical protein
MKVVGACVAVAVMLFGATACSGGDGKSGGNSGTSNGGNPQSGAQGPPAPVPLPGKVDLPKGAEELGGVISRQAQTARWVRTSVVYTGKDGAGSSDARLDAQIRLGPGPTEALMTAVDSRDGKRSTTHAIMTGGLYFTRVEGEEQVKGKPWLRLSHTELNNAQLGPFATVFTGVLTKLESEIKKLSADSGTALVRRGKLKGAPTRATVNGVRVQRYRGTTDTEAMAEVDSDYRQMAQRGFKQIPWTLWLAENGLPQRFTATIGREDTTVQSVTTYSGWGRPIAIKPPPPAQVATVADVIKG